MQGGASLRHARRGKATVRLEGGSDRRDGVGIRYHLCDRDQMGQKFLDILYLLMFMPTPLSYLSRPFLFTHDCNDVYEWRRTNSDCV